MQTCSRGEPSPPKWWSQLKYRADVNSPEFSISAMTRSVCSARAATFSSEGLCSPVSMFGSFVDSHDSSYQLRQGWPVHDKEPSTAVRRFTYFRSLGFVVENRCLVAM